MSFHVVATGACCHNLCISAHTLVSMVPRPHQAKAAFLEAPLVAQLPYSKESCATPPVTHTIYTTRRRQDSRRTALILPTAIGLVRIASAGDRAVAIRELTQ